jgi:serine/threonine protein kinase/DNA-binding response OmpR family regulator
MQNDAAALLTRDEFLRILSDSGLFAPDELAALAQATSALPDAEALSHHLESTGRVTPFQTRALRARKFAELLIGNYEVLDRLGAGGMGTVFRARHRRMKRVVALKVMSRELCRDQKSVQRFQREVEAIARLSHPNIVLAYDADEAEIGHFLVMEYVNGQDLASLVQRLGPLTVGAAVNCIRQAARGLEYAHGRGIVHRDIKPANLLRDAGGTVKITDLGLARLNEPLGGPVANSALTQAGGVVGTVDYMSPEQAFDSTSVDHRADIYSLGCTLYYLLTGAPPYTGSTIMATLLKHRESPVPALAGVRAAVPPALDAVFHQMMAKNPAHRFSTMSELLAALDQVPLPDVEPQRPTESAAVSSGTLSGQGLTTSIQLPTGGVPATDQTAAFEPGAVPRAPQAPPTVLVVEPSRTQAGIIQRYLRALGIEPFPGVTSGAGAVDAIKRHRPEVVVSALHLNDMTGAQLAERLLAEDAKGAPAFLLISSAGAEVGSLSRAGNAHVLTKPFTLEQLAQALSALLHRTLNPVPGTVTPELSLWGSGSQPGASLSGRVERAKLKVLLVDDSATARAHVRGILQGLGLSRFVEADNGATAVALAVKDVFDLIVTDYNMPLMDGHGLVGFLRQNPATAAVPVILVTTETDPRKLDTVRQLGGVDVFDKSFCPEVVRPILDRLFGA